MGRLLKAREHSKKALGCALNMAKHKEGIIRTRQLNHKDSSWMEAGARSSTLVAGPSNSTRVSNML